MTEPWVTVSDAIDDLPSLDSDAAVEIGSHDGRRHQESTRETYDQLAAGEVPHDRYSPRRLYADRPSFTVTSSEGATPIHHEEARMTTAREIARLQTFPDDFEFTPDSRRETCRLVANAVPPLLAERIADVMQV